LLRCTGPIGRCAVCFDYSARARHGPRRCATASPIGPFMGAMGRSEFIYSQCVVRMIGRNSGQ
jgi:hypothetical protein